MVRTLTEEEKQSIIDFTTPYGGGITFCNNTDISMKAMIRLREKGNAEEHIVRAARRFMKTKDFTERLAEVRAVKETYNNQ